jgi:hypothetical protein
VKDIDIQEMKFTSYKGKAGVTIFKYSMIEDTKEYSPNVEIDESELPFF